MDQEHLENLSGEFRAEMAASEDSRETAVAWNLAASVQDTNAFARIGYKLASRLVKKDGPVIEKLSVLLTERGSLDEASLIGMVSKERFAIFGVPGSNCASGGETNWNNEGPGFLSPRAWGEFPHRWQLP